MLCRCAIWFLALLPALAWGESHEARIPLKKGKASFSAVSDAICQDLHVDPPKFVRWIGPDVDLNGINGTTFVTAVNGSLGDGLRVTLTPDCLVFHIDPDKLPKDCNSTRRAVRVFTAIESPQATAAMQKHYGLHLPSPLDTRRPLVLLIHGLDCGTDIWGDMIDRLHRDGWQVATFGYPSDGPIQEDSAFLACQLLDLHRTYPDLRIDIVAHSMGGLVVRDFVEGVNYQGGVDRLIMLGTPNAGSRWARWRWPLGVQQQYHLWRSDPAWSTTWIITDGLGEAGDDLMPGSKFLQQLNARPRREGVRYTIIAGNQCPASRIGADWVACTSGWIPARASHWWGFRQCKARLDHEADALRHQTGDADGPVTLTSAALGGVTDFVVIPADHIALACGDPPAAWGVIRDRLKH